MASNHGINDLRSSGELKEIFIYPLKTWISKKGYEQFWHPHQKRPMLTHRYVIESILNGEISKGKEVHHRDRNKLNNRPANLDVMTKAEHEAIHKGGAKNRPFRNKK